MTITLGRHSQCVGESECSGFSADLYKQLSNGNYDWPVSILRLEGDFDVYLQEHRTARKRAARAVKLGYFFNRFDRSDWVEDVYEINTSKPIRQGRPMSVGYTRRPTFSPLPHYPCPRHRIDTWGVFHEETDALVAYLVFYLSGDMAMVSQILGHAEHLENDVMYLLCVETFKRAPKPLTVFYNRHDSGTDGLRFFKERLGFEPERVEWAA